MYKKNTDPADSDEGSTQACVVRSDLIYLLMEFGPAYLENVAAFVDFERKYIKKVPETREHPKAITEEPIDQPLPPTLDFPKHTFHETRYWLTAAYSLKDKKDIVYNEPKWLIKQRNEPEKPPQPEDHIKRPMPKEPLIPWSRLWPFLRNALSVTYTVENIDIEAVVNRIANMEPIKTLPRKKQSGWSQPVEIIIDCNPYLLPFRDDAFGLCHTLKVICGRRAGLRVQLCENGPEGLFNIWKDRTRAKPFRLPEPGAPALIISDCGCNDAQNETAASWLRFGKRLRSAGVTPTVLMLGSPLQWDADHARIFRLVCWDKGFRLPRLDHPDSRGMAPLPPEPEKTARMVEHLLRLLSPAVVIEHALLRAMRMKVCGPEADVGIETAAWLSEDVSRHPLGFMFKNETVEKYRNGFKQLLPELQKKAIDLIK
jgi:hypothetical protein